MTKNNRRDFLLVLMLLYWLNLGFGQSKEVRLLVKFKKEVNGKHFFKARENSRSNFELLRERQVSKLFNIHQLIIRDEDVKNTIEKLRQEIDIISVNEDSPLFLRKNDTNPSDSLFTEQWNLTKIQIPEVWEITQGGTTTNGDEIVVAVLDDGFDKDHPDLVNNIWKNKAEIPDNEVDDDGNGYIDDYYGLNLKNLSDKHPVLQHGTQVSGIIGAQSDNNIGIAGINWNIKILFLSEVSSVGELLEAYEYIYNLRRLYNKSDGVEGALIVCNNNSFGINNKRPEEVGLGNELCQMFDLMGSVGILSIGAGPNNSVDVDMVGDIPTNCPSSHFIGVASSNRANLLGEDSGFGKISIDLTSPGEEIFTTERKENYGATSGTSYAAPHVTGVVGLMYSVICKDLVDGVTQNPSNISLLIKDAILKSVDKLPAFEETTVTGGGVNALKAVQFLENSCVKITPNNTLQIVKIAPNPIQNFFTVDFEVAEFIEHRLLIVNSLGEIFLDKNVLPSQFATPRITENIANYSQGIYFVLLQNDKEIVAHKILKMD